MCTQCIPLCTCSLYTLIDILVYTYSYTHTIGGEQPSLPWNRIFPHFSNAPGRTYNQIPYPWPEHIARDRQVYDIMYTNYSGHFSDGNIMNATHQYPWSQRVSVAAFYASYGEHRQIVYESARLNPTLIHAHFDCFLWGKTFPPPKSLDPTAEVLELPSSVGSVTFNETILERWQKLPFGHAEGLFAQCKLDEYTHEYHGRYKYPGQYKYVIVPLGAGGKSLSGRLGNLLAYSGCVVLLQESSFTYHFSARLKPWVHYVPLSYSMVSKLKRIFRSCVLRLCVLYRRMWLTRLSGCETTITWPGASHTTLVYSPPPIYALKTTTAM